MESAHPIEMHITDDLVRSRLTTFFRFFLALPHLIWSAIWGIGAIFVVIVSWFATLAKGQTPQGLHDFLARYLRYTVHTNSYFYLVAEPFPSFTADKPYPIDVTLAPPAPQRRLITAFRLILVIPVAIVAGVLGYLTQVLAVISWFVALFTGRVPQGVRNLSAWCIKFTTQTYGYGFLLTDRYPSFDSLTPTV
jgi:Domain of unknown function (DUF4389)